MAAQDGDIVINLRLDDKDFAVTVVNSGKLLRELRGNLDKAATGVDGIQKHFGSFSTSLRHTVMSLAAVRFAAMDFYDAFLRLPRSILETSGEIERLTKLMAGLSKQTTEAGKMRESLDNTNYILNLAKRAPFEIKALADSFVKLKSGGIDPTNGSMQALIDSVARFGGDSQALHRASVAIQQMAGKGVISMEELRQQLGEAVPDAIRMMAEGMGMSMADLVKQISLGAVESTDALRRMFTMMEFYNRGAAKEMMETWTGLTSRVKTEWTILQTEIGNAGFADAVKDQLKDLIAFMGSGEGVNFARKFGKDLGDLVRSLREVIDTLRENWKWIKLVGEALLVSFAVGKVIGIINALRDSLRAVAAASAVNIKKYRDEADAKARSEAQKAAIDVKANNDQIVRDAAALQRRNAYYKGLLTSHAKYLAQINALETANAATAARVTNAGRDIANSRVYQDRARKIQQMRDELAGLEKTIAKEREWRNTTRESMGVLIQQSDALDKKAKITASAADKMGILTKASIGMRAGFAALGGPIGLITTALMIGIPAWLEWGNSGEKAIQKIKDALSSGSANQETIDLIGKQLNEKRKEFDELNNKSRSFSFLPSTADDVQKENAERNRLKNEIAELEKGLIDARTIKIKNEADASFRVQRDAFQKEMDETAAFYTNKAGLALDEARKQLEGKKKGSLEEINIEKEKNKTIQRLAQEQAEALYKIVDKQHQKAKADLDEARKGGDPARIKGAQERFNELTDQLTDRDRHRKNALHLSDPANLKEDKTKKPDPLTQEVEKAKADLEAAKIRMDDLLDGAVSFDKLRAAAIAKLEGDRLAGRFNTKDARGNSVAPSKDDPRIPEAATYNAKEDQVNRERQVQKALTNVAAQAAQERKNALERFDSSDNFDRESTGVRRLERNFAKLKETLVEGTPAFDNFDKEIKSVLSDQALADLLNFTATFKKEMNDLDVYLQDTDIGHKQKAFEVEMIALNSQLEVRKQTILKNADLTSAETAALIKRAEEETYKYLLKLAERHAKDMRSPLQQLSVDWLDITKRMRDASVRWANDTMDALVMLVKGGKVEWRSLVDSILTDILRIQMQKTFGKAMNSALDKGVNFLSDMMGVQNPLGGGSGDLPIDSATGAVKTVNVTDTRMAGSIKEAVIEQKDVFNTAETRLVSMWEGVKTGFSNVFTGMTQMIRGLGSGLYSVFSGIAGGLKNVFSGMFSGGGGSGILGEIFDIVSTGVSGAMSGFGGGFGGATTGIMSATANGASATFGDISGSLFKSFAHFEKGGVMTEFGPVELRKYATGGVASSPQLALYGEGSMREAFVPLPDGRSIPVSFVGKGAAGAAPGSASIVNIAITVNEADGGDKSESNGDDAGVWNRMAQKVKAVVKETLVVEKRPGGVLYK